MKKILNIILMSILLLNILENTAFAKTNPIALFINSKAIQLDQQPIIKKNRLLVPLRGVFEAMGSTVSFDPKLNTISIIKDSYQITLKPNSSIAYINNKKITLDQSAIIANKRTMVPLRFISESIGAKVKWTASTKSVDINFQAQPDFMVIDIQ